MAGAAEEIVVVARWQVAGDALGDVLEHVAAVRTASLQEPGCLGYEVFQAPESPTTLLLLERYRDAAALDAHRNSPHYAALVVERIVPRLEARQVELLEARRPA